MLEHHPFKIFIPENTRYLILGSFTTYKAQKNHSKYKPDYDWYYNSGRNQFWKIMEKVFDKKLPNTKTKKELFRKQQIALGDIILQCRRIKDSSLDNSLKNITYNKKSISDVLRKNKIKNIFFTSRFVEKHFLKNFKEIVENYPKIKLITLPSPSPRYTKLTLIAKIDIYKKHFLNKR